MQIKTILNNILDEITAQIDHIEQNQLNQFCDAIITANHIFLAGTGRSGLIISAFANRLMHLGLSVSVINEISKPKANGDDVLILGSHSGETASLIAYAKQAQKLGVKVIILTGNANSTLAKLADSCVTVKIELSHFTQPMGSTFEQLALLIYDSVIYRLMGLLHQSPELMKSRHANIE